MPTIDAANHVRVFGAAGAFGAIGAGSYNNAARKVADPLYTVLDGDSLTAEARDVIELIADHGAVLATGHLSEDEVFAVVEHALSLNHDKIIVTHPEMQCPNLSIETQVALAKRGCVMEYCAVNCMPMFQSVTSEQMIDAIEAVGADNAVIATDSGQPFTPKTPDMFRSFAQVLHEKGVALEDIWKMAMRNPARLLGVEPAHAEVQKMNELFGVAQDPNDA